MRRRLVLALGALLVASTLALPATWVDVEVTCPVCGTVNIFQGIGSFGTYVYREPSRFQYVFWPATTDKFLYTCRRCHLTTYMQDFAGVPADRMTELAEMLEREAGIEGAVVPYYEVPMTIRLAIAEKVYELLGRDDGFWCEFRRIEGFHLAEAGMAGPAREARLRALHLAEGLLESVESGLRKEIFVIVAAMRLYTGDMTGARTALDEAQRVRFRADGMDPADNEGFDAFLVELIEAFRAERLPIHN